MIDKKSFKKAIAAQLESANFVQKDQSWYLNGRDTIVVINLQKNDWDDEYFFNIRIWIKALGNYEFQDNNKWHMSHRLERLFPEDKILIRGSSSLLIGTEQLLNDLSVFIKTKLVPFLIECTDEKKLKDYMAAGRFKLGFVRKDAKKYLLS
jgi:hypothetical protein